MSYRLVDQATSAGYQRAPMLPEVSRGLGCSCSSAGLGVFAGGVDWNSWGWQEWGLILAGAYVLGSVVFTTRAKVASGRRYKRRISKRLEDLTR